MAEKTFDLSVILKMVDQLTSPLKRVGVGVGRYSTRVKKADKDTKNWSKSLESLGKSMTSIGKKMTTRVTTPLVALNAAMFKTAVDFETAWTGVLKTVDASVPELAQLKTELQDLALQIPLATEEIFGIGEAAGQLGIETKNIASFTKVMADLGVTTNLTAREAATSLARLANITQMPQDQFDRLGSTIVGLGNNLATTEAEIVNMGLRLAAAGNLVGMSEAQILGLAGALSSLGVRAESGGTAFSQVMRKISKEVGTGSDKIWGFAKISGLTIKEFEKLWKKDAVDALTRFTKGLSGLESQGINVIQVLEAFGLEGARISDSLLRAAGAGKKFTDNIKLGNKFWEENNALTEEANLRYKTAASRIRIFWNEIKQLADSFGRHLLPSVQKVSDFFIPMIRWLKALSPEVKKTITDIAAFVAIIGPALVVLGGIISAIGGSLGLIALAVGLTILLTPLILIVGAFVLMAPAIKAAFKELKIFGSWVKDISKDMRIFLDYLSEMRGFVTGGGVGGFIIRKAISGIEGLRDREVPVPTQLGSSHRSQTDVRIKVSSDQGSTATVEGVKSKGGSNVQVMNESHLGMNLFYAH